ncbi:MAG: glycosyltransferase family 39 protein, partial [Frankia sp.]|nr:glycosyltransferase family 39 protein [Frankia sp.]
MPAALALAVAAVLAVATEVWTRPLWYDEIWRPHFLAEPPATFWGELAHANTPSALGWAALTRLVGEIVGWHAWALRLPELVALTLLPVATYLLARRFTGPAAAGLAAACVGLSGVGIDLGTQLKPYAVEALAAVVIVRLWLVERRPVAARAAAGGLGLFVVPAAFLIIPLAAADLVAAGRARLRRARAAPAAAPPLALCGLHTLL